jgi:hypothetical protein
MCEKGFASKTELEEHEGEHATCGIDGCKYTAHSSVLGGILVFEYYGPIPLDSQNLMTNKKPQIIYMGIVLIICKVGQG